MSLDLQQLRRAIMAAPAQGLALLPVDRATLVEIERLIVKEQAGQATASASA